MTAKRFSYALGNVDVKYIDEASAYTAKKKKNTWVKWVSAAACLSLIITGAIFGNIFYSPDSPVNNITSYFVITAHAANGVSTDLSLAESCFNSGSAKENAFGVDIPLFDFSVRPSNWGGNEALYSKFDISVSYNGTRVEDRDKHMMVAYLIPTPDSGESWAYSVMGWFTEPTDIIVTIMDKKSREIVETITVNVNYLADSQEYELEVTELNTKFAEQKNAVEADNALMEYFFDQGYISEYPAYFGGRYIEDNKLHVRLVSPTDEELQKITSVLAQYGNDVVFEYGELSMSDLQAYADKTAKELRNLGYGVTSWYVDNVTGNIVIGVLEKDFTAVTALIANGENNAPKIIVEKGAYTSAD